MSRVAALLGVSILLVNLACASICGVRAVEDQSQLPPCHQHKETAKSCSTQDWADNVAKVMVVPPMAVTQALPERVAPVLVSRSTPPESRTLSPPTPLRI